MSKEARGGERINSMNITTHAKQDFEFHLHLTMGEAMVLSGLFAYGGDKLLKKSLELGSCVKEGVADPAPVMDVLYHKICHDLNDEVNRCMELRRVFHNPKQFDIVPKPKDTAP